MKKQPQLQNLFLLGFKAKLFSLTFVSILSFSVIGVAQPNPPPNNSGGNPTTRGMYVSCRDVPIFEIQANGNAFDLINTPNTSKLFNYCTSHFISYIALYSLAQRHTNNIDDPIIGNIAYLPAIMAFLDAAHSRGIKVGIVISNKEFLDLGTTYGNFITSPFYYIVPKSPWDSTCFVYNTSRVLSIKSNIGQQRDINTGFAPEDSLLNPTDTAYGALELSEMLKAVMRVLQYSTQVSEFIANSCYGCSSKIGNTAITTSPVPPPPQYIFDYMSLEYEYWNKTTYELADTIGTNGMTQQKKAWNNFGEVAGAMIYVSSIMCGLTKNELELRIVPPKQDLNLTQPITPWDAPAQDMPSAQDQVNFITKYFHRILLSDYTSNWSNLIIKTASTHTRFSNIPSTLNPDERNWIMPLFSAATVGVQKHCFDTLRYIFNTTIPDTSDNSYLGPLLDTSSWATMYKLESMYIQTYENAVYYHLYPAWQFGPCNEYFLTTPTTCGLDTSYNKIVGFMWFNYSFLRDINRLHQEYSRLNAPSNLLLNFSNSDNLLYLRTIKAKPNAAFGELKIFDLSGKQVYSETFYSLNQTFSLNHLKNGMYLCKLFSSGETGTIKVRVLKN